jgi:hypothetical protein
MSTPTFNAILDKRLDEIEAPTLLPRGTYLATIIDVNPDVVSREKKTPGVEFTFKLVNPIFVSDQQALIDAGGCDGREVKYSYWLTENSAFMLRNFLVHHVGIEMADRSLRQAIGEARGRQVGVQLQHTLTKGNEPRQIHFVETTLKP